MAQMKTNREAALMWNEVYQRAQDSNADDMTQQRIRKIIQYYDRKPPNDYATGDLPETIKVYCFGCREKYITLSVNKLICTHCGHDNATDGEEI